MTRSPCITKVMVPRTLVFGLEEAKASPWNVACFRSVICIDNMHQLWYHGNLNLSFRIPAVVQTDSGTLLAFAEVTIKL